MFRDREDAGRQLAERLQGRAWHDPLVLAIPRGGVVVGAQLARALGADLDVVLSRKLRAPGQPELALGAVSESGAVYLDRGLCKAVAPPAGYLLQERRFQAAEIAWRQRLFRGVRPAAPVAGRSVIVTDDGLATGATLIAALQTIQAQGPRELVAAVPVASPDRLENVRRWCDDVVCVAAPESFRTLSASYEDFSPVEDAQVIELLRPFAPGPRRQAV
jgi:predicted phosphoribosyltransferase